MHHTKGTSPYTSHVSIKTVATLILVVLCLAFCIFATWTYTHRLSPAPVSYTHLRAHET